MGDADAAAQDMAGEPPPADGSEPGAPRRPDKTTQELDVGWGEPPHESDQGSDDERLLRERPPHWER